MKNIPNFIIYLIVFINGGAVMLCELLGAKVTAPFFGTSLYVWSTAIGVTLGALTAGYYFGGWISSKKNIQKYLQWSLLMSGLFLIIMPFSAVAIMKHTILLNVKMGSIISMLFFLFPPLFFMGVISPLSIELLTISDKGAGKNAGYLYAISTVGGIFMTFLSGFYLIPEFGIKNPAIFYGLIQLFIPIVLFINQKKIIKVLFLISALMFLSFFFKNNQKPSKFALRYCSESILGQLKVIDYKTSKSNWRTLLINNYPQTYLNLDSIDDLTKGYVSIVVNLIRNLKRKHNALTLGLGGGIIARNLYLEGFNTEAVDIDSRQSEVARKYFFLPKEVKIIIDDARHYLNISKKKYSFIMNDLAIGESQPEHILTLEAFKKIKSNLKIGGMVCVNFFGYVNGKKGIPLLSVFKTMKSANLATIILAYHESEKARSSVLVGYNGQKKDLISLIKQSRLSKFIVNVSSKKMTNIKVLSDEFPFLDKILNPVVIEWRNRYNKFLLKSGLFF